MQLPRNCFPVCASTAFSSNTATNTRAVSNPLGSWPQAKTVVLGLVNTKRLELEKPQDLLKRIDQAAKLMPLENLALSPQCGFASVAEGNPVTEDVDWAKMRLVANVARKVWG